MASSDQPKVIAERFWAIQLSDSDHRKWNEKLNRLSFNWSGTKILRTFTLDKIQKSVSKTYPNLSKKKAKNLAEGIFTFLKVKEKDVVADVKETGQVQKLGIVKYVKQGSYKIEMIIQWILKNKINYQLRIFNPQLEIQDIDVYSKGQLKFLIDPPFAFKMSSNKKFIKEEKNSLITGDTDFISTKSIPAENIFSGSTSVVASPGIINILRKNDTHLSVNLANNENIVKIERGKPIVTVGESGNAPPKFDTGGSIKLFYGTNRNLTGKKGYNNFYGNEFTKELKVGMCEVNIPRGHTEGEIERPGKFLYLIEWGENPKKDIMITGIEQMQKDDFFKALSDSDEKSAMIFIHGYKNSFADAARRAGQLAWDMPFQGISGFYSWPSDAKLKSYLPDGYFNRVSLTLLETFLTEFVMQTKVEKLHLIAHSMGSLLLAATLDKILCSNKLKSKQSVIKQVVFGAPDIGQDEFELNFLPSIADANLRPTLYASDKDFPVKIPGITRKNKPGLGLAGKSLFVDKRIDTIDASNVEVDGAMKHSYMFETKELLSDLYFLLNRELDPARRRLRRRKKNDIPYWLFAK